MAERGKLKTTALEHLYSLLKQVSAKLKNAAYD